MSTAFFSKVASVIGLLGLGYLVLRMLNLTLPTPKTVREFIFATFWVYPSRIDKQRIKHNKIAWLVVVIFIYLTMISFF